jgi:hypothetical protein
MQKRNWVDFICQMDLLELLHQQDNCQVSVVPLIIKCDRFKNHPKFTIIPYRFQFGVSLEDFQDFVSVLDDKPIDIKNSNFPRLSQLFEEFGFQALLAKLSAHRWSRGLTDAQTTECRTRI